MILDAEKRGMLKPDSIICEPTSGNQGIGLALVAAVRGYKAIIIMPDSVSGERRKLIEQYGAEVILCHDGGDIGKVINDCLQTALQMAKENPNIFVPQQFENPANPAVHREQTGREIIEQLGDLSLHGFCSGIGTGGTISGIGTILREKYPDIEIWALEPENAAILSGGKIGSHIQMGIGDGLIPHNLNTKIYRQVVVVTDRDALQTAKDLARREGLMCGISSGANVCTALRMAKKLGKGKRVITLLPDTAERYFSTPLFD
jgi:cysteine synthase A